MKLQFSKPLLAFLVGLAGEAVAAKIVVSEGDYAIDSETKIQEVLASDGIEVADGASVTYSDADHDLNLSVPLSGAGTFRNLGGKALILATPNADFTGTWGFTNSTVVVSNGLALGSASAKVYVRNSTQEKIDCLHFGGDGLTNNVRLFVGNGYYRFKANPKEHLVFNGLFTRLLHGKFSLGNVHFRGGWYAGNDSGSPAFESLGPSGEEGATLKGLYDYFECQVDDPGWFCLYGNNAGIRHYLFQNDEAEKPNAIYTMLIRRSYVHCGSKNIFGSRSQYVDVRLGGKYYTTEWNTNVFDLNGYDQTVAHIYCDFEDAYNESYGKGVLPADGEKYVTTVTSATPATLTICGSTAHVTDTLFSGAVSLLCCGSGAYEIANFLATTSGRLTVSNGAPVTLKWNAGWTGPVRICDKSTLYVNDTTRAFSSDSTDLEIEAGGVLNVTNATISVRTLRLGGAEVPAGLYTIGGMKAGGYGAYFKGEDSETISVRGAVASARRTNIRDWLVYELVPDRVTPTDGQIETNDVRDALTWSAAAPYLPKAFSRYDAEADAANFAKFGRPQELTVKTEKVQEPYSYRLYVTNEMQVLNFPRNYATDSETGKHYVYAQNLLYKEIPPITSSSVTIRVTCRWDGMHDQTDYSSFVYDQYLFQLQKDNHHYFSATAETVTSSTTNSSAYIRWAMGGTYAALNHSGSQNTIFSNKTWVDLIYVVEAVEAQKTRVRIYFVNPKNDQGGLMLKMDTTYDMASPFPAQTGSYLSLGNSVSTSATTTKWVGTTTDSGRRAFASFLGAIARFEIYDKALSREELNALLAGNGAGSTAKLGVRDGSGDEFANPDDEGIVEAFDPRTMPAHKMRRQLDAANPTLTLKMALNPEEDRLTRTLRLAVVHEDAVGSLPVELRVNGRLLETFDFGEELEHLFYLRDRCCRRDGDGYLTITLTRPEGYRNGVLAIDTLELSGGWAVGLLGDSASTRWPFGGVQKVNDYSSKDNRVGVIGGTWKNPFLYDILYGLRKDKAAIWYPKQEIAFDLPGEIVETNAVCTLTYRAWYVNNNKTEWDVYVNGTVVDHKGPDVTAGLYSVPVPTSLLNEGYNVFCISNSSSSFLSTQGSSDYDQLYIGGYKFEFAPAWARKGTVFLIK